MANLCGMIFLVSVLIRAGVSGDGSEDSRGVLVALLCVILFLLILLTVGFTVVCMKMNEDSSGQEAFALLEKCREETVAKTKETKESDSDSEVSPSNHDSDSPSTETCPSSSDSEEDKGECEAKDSTSGTTLFIEIKDSGCNNIDLD